MDVPQLLMRLTQNRWAWRTFLALVALVPVLLVLPHARSLVVRNAVITAYLGDIKAPIDGRIETIDVSPGSVARAGQAAMAIHNVRVNRGELAGLEVRLGQAESQISRLRENLASVSKLASARNTQQDDFVDAVERDLRRRLRDAEDETPAREADLKAAESSLERVRNLAADDLASPAELESADAAYQQAVADRASNQLLRRRLAEQLEEIEKGVFQIDQPDGIMFTRQMAQQLDLEVIRLEQTLRDRETEWKALEAEYAAAKIAWENSAHAEIELKPGATVWNVYATRGTWTTEGTVLMSVVDCSNLMADIAVDDATLELIEPGQKVRLRLFGTFESVSATVVLVRGSAGLGDIPVLAAEVHNRGDRKGRVLARLDESRLAGLAENSCAIGRTTYAEFEGISVLETILYPLFR